MAVRACPPQPRYGRSLELKRLLVLVAGVVIAVMLSLLIFIGEAVRDAFDPRKTLR